MFENQNIEYFEKVLEGKKLFLFGAGGSARKTITFCQKHNYIISGVFDNNKDNWGKTIGGCLISSPLNLVEKHNEEYLVLIASVHLVEIANQLKKWVLNIFFLHIYVKCFQLDNWFLYLMKI